MGEIVQCKNGAVKGFFENGVYKYFSVPFAKPPIGDLRFKRAQEADCWEGVKDCTKMPPKPIQFVAPVDMGESEDCLYLNIWAPEHAENCPVFVWIYGGGLVYGSNSDPSYDGENMAKKGIVYVAVSYRLGIFGCYDFAQYDDAFETNCATSDVLQSLRFVKENISSFGGNPDNITICGESGGGMQVMHMLACPAAKGLFHKAIAESAPMSILGGKKAAKYFVDLILEQLHKTPMQVRDLLEMSTEELKKACIEVMKIYQKDYPYIWMAGPVFGTDLLPEQPWEALVHGSAEGIDLIIGTNHDEGTCFIRTFDETQLSMPHTWEEIKHMLELNKKGDLFKEFKDYYVKLHPEDEFLQMSEIATDRGFFYETMLAVDAQKDKSNVWLYRFDYVPAAFRQMGMGAVHSVEIGFALDNFGKGYFSRCLEGSPQKELDSVRDQMNGAWVAFCKTGNPNHSGSNWKKYDDKEKLTHVFNVIASEESDYRRASYELWKKIGTLYTDEMID